MPVCLREKFRGRIVIHPSGTDTAILTEAPGSNFCGPRQFLHLMDQVLPASSRQSDFQNRTLPVIETDFLSCAAPLTCCDLRHILMFDADRSDAQGKVAIDIVCNDKAKLVDLPWRKFTGWNNAAKYTGHESAEIDPNI